MKSLCTYVPFQILIGVLFGILYLPTNTPIFLICFFVILLILFIFLKKKRMAKSYMVLTIVLIFGILIGWVSVFLNNDLLQKDHYSRFKKDNSYLGITIVKTLKSSSKVWKYYGDVNFVNSQQSNGTILIELLKDSVAQGKLEIGDKFVCRGIVRNINSAKSPYNFDYKKYLYLKKIYGKIRIKTYVKTGEELSLLYKIQKYRNRVVVKLEKSNLSENTINLMKAMLLGDRKGLSKDLKDSFTNAGVVHLIAISGMHVGVLYLLLLYSFGFVKRLPKGNYLYVIIILVGLWTFAIFSGLSSSVVRTVTMFSFIVLAKLKKRKSLLLEPIISSMLILLLIHPNYLFDVGFQLSYAAVISIVVYYPLCTERLKQQNKIIKYFIDVLIVSIIAQVGVLAITLYYFHQLPLQFLMANFIAVSLLPVVLYGGFLVLMKIMFFDSITFLEQYYDIFIQNYINVIQYFSSLEFLILKELSLSKTSVFLYYLLLFLIWRLFEQNNIRRWNIFLWGVLMFQFVSIYNSYKVFNKHELIVYNDYLNTIITLKKGNKLTVLENDFDADYLVKNKIANNINLINSLRREVFVFKDQIYLIVDESLAYDQLKSTKMILIISNNPKINLERVLMKLTPSKVIVTAKNYTSNVNKWKSTCSKLQVPFYDISKQGVYLMN